MKKSEVIRLIEDWLVEREAYQNTPVHPLVSVQEGHLDEGGHRGGPTQTRATGRSKPPIRDMRGVNARVDRIMSVLKELDGMYYQTLITYALTGKIEDTVKHTKNKNPSQVFKNINEGTAAFKAAWLVI